MRFARRALAGAAVLLAYGAAPLSPVPQAAWPAYQYRGDHNAVFAAPPGGAVWKRTFGGKINGALSIVGSTLYVESMGEDRKLYALDLGSGAIRWSAALPNIAMNAPVVAGGIVFAGTGSNHIMVDAGASALIGIPGGDYVIAFDAKSGAPLWRYNTPGEDMPTGAAGVVGETPAFLFAGGDGHLRALSAADGKLLWQNRFPGIAPMSSLALAGNLVVGSSETTPSFTLAAHEAENQADLENDTWTWAARISDGQFVWVAPHGWADTSPTVAGGRVFTEDIYVPPTTAQEKKAGKYEGDDLQAVVCALDLRDGRLLWSYHDDRLGPADGAGSLELSIAGLYSEGVFYDSLLYSNRFAAFDAASGRVLWRTPTTGRVKMSAVLKDGLVYFGDTAGYFYVVRATDGAILAKTKFPEIFTTSPPVIVGDRLFVANSSTLYALRLEDLRRGVISAP